MASHSGRRFTAPPTIGPVLIALLAAGYCLSGERSAICGQAPPGGQPDYAYFQKAQQQIAAQRKVADENYQKVSAAAQPQIDQRAKARGGADQGRQQLGATLAEINARLQPNAPPLPPGTPGYRVVPGMRVDVIMKDGKSHYSGALVGIDGTKVLLQTVPLPGAEPHGFDVGNVQAFQTKFGIFAYDARTGRIVPGVTYYQLNTAGQFERLPGNTGDAFLGQDAKIVGPTNSAWATLDVGADGSWVVGLPIPLTSSPQAIPAANFRQIITAMGVYTYDSQARNYAYKSHADIAAAAQQTKDAAGKAEYQQEWDRNVQKYQLGTSRLQAMTPSIVTGGGGPAWWQTNPGPGNTPPGGSTRP